jgi:hypothetical protein
MQGILADTTRYHQIPFRGVICARYMPSQRSKSSIPSQGIHRAGSEPCVFGKCPSRVRLINLVPHIYIYIYIYPVAAAYSATVLLAWKYRA